jgi:hypothetical protein
VIAITFATIVIIVLLGILVLALAKKNPSPRKSGPAITLNKNFVQDKWLEIEKTFSLGGPSHFKTSLMEADKLVDYVLKARGVKGETFAERLKGAKSKFPNYSDYNNLWFAHKVRNHIAHETTHELNSAEAKRALEYFKKALQVLGAL